MPAFYTKSVGIGRIHRDFFLAFIYAFVIICNRKTTKESEYNYLFRLFEFTLPNFKQTLQLNAF